MKNIVVTLLICCLFSSSYAQKKTNIALLGKAKPNGVWLRWAPTDIATWQMANSMGYLIERVTLDADGNVEPSSRQLLTSKPIKPLSDEEFELIHNPSNEVLAVQELLYGETFRPLQADNIGSVLSTRQTMENRFGFLLMMCDASLDAAKAAGLFFIDVTAVASQHYVYRLKIVDNTMAQSAATVTVTAGSEPLMRSITDLKATFDNRRTTLSWSTLLHKGMYSAYYIEKSTDGKEFRKLSDVPFVPMSRNNNSHKAFAVDTLNSNDQIVYYRILGLSPFAERGPYSNVVSGKGKEPMTGLLVIRQAKVLDNQHIQVNWEFPPSAEKAIEGFVVSYAAKPSGPTIDLTKKPLPKSARTYTGDCALNNAYFTIRAVDKQGKQITRSFQYLAQRPDETPPAAPTGLQGEARVNGTVVLAWSMNEEPDLLGYRIYKSNSLHEDFIEITKEIVTATTYIDTINIHVLNKKIYYRVVAMDRNYNPSAYSNVLSLSRPDVVPPAPPVINALNVTPGCIAVHWTGSASDDVKIYELSRVEQAEKLKRVIKTWTATDTLTYFLDPAVELGKVYGYEISVYDSSGNHSEATTNLVTYETGIRKPVTSLTSTVNRDERQIKLDWTYATPALKCLIYKQRNDGVLTLFKTLEGDASSYIDHEVTINNVYTYKIQLVFRKGIRSLLSEGVKAIY